MTLAQGIAEAWRARKRSVEVDGVALAYVDDGPPDGPAVVLLHGNPTSSFLWRDVVPPLVRAGYRCVAPDLVGMGDSAPLPDSGPDRYGLFEHARYLDGFLDALVAEGPVALVVHDWGSALGFSWARRHPDRVAAIAYTEAIVRPVSWSEWPEAAAGIFRALRSDKGEDLVLERNAFVERILPASVLDPLPEEVLDEYRRPFLEAGERRRPMLTWPRQIPLDGEPADVTAEVQAYADWLATAPVPKLLLDADPGSILVGAQRDTCLAWPHQEVVRVRGSHFVQEDSGAELGAAIAAWLPRVAGRSRPAAG